ncbi:MAG: YggT family protein [Thermacetogeniaceae bacterium]|jgi:YggT family protein|nr:YggT family protein [Thermoanaerobacterales bacterium]NLN22126.1 YggT family protein [Syntrophomonadaceae bacterium]
MNLTFIISVISLAIDIYFWLIVARIILSFIRPRTYHPIIRFIYEITEPLLSLCRRLLPGTVMNIDFSPLLAVIFLEVVRALLISLARSLM